MHKMLITSLSALALMTGAAVAQTGGATTQAPAPQGQMHNQSSGSSATARPTNLPGNVSIDQIIDRTVVGADGEKIGKVTDVILGPNGEAQLLVVESGGFLGIGGKDVAVDIALAQFQAGDNTIKVQDITQASVRDMPEFHYDDSMTSLNRGPRGGQTQPQNQPQTQQKQ